MLDMIIRMVAIVTGLVFGGILMFSSSITALMISGFVFCLAALIAMICAIPEEDEEEYEA